MSKIDEILLAEAEAYVIHLLDHRLSKSFRYHFSEHTKEVLRNSEIIGKYSNLKEDDLNILRMSALFHDVGYIDIYIGHDVRSAKYAEDFLIKKDVNQQQISKIKNAILSTQVPQNPLDEISEILCDADLVYLSHEKDYFAQAELLRNEWIEVGLENLTQNNFLKKSAKFFNSHKFHSEYGKNILQPKKEKVAKLIKEKLSGVYQKDISLEN